jgi:DNA-directed RNA polymerase beta subunit
LIEVQLESFQRLKTEGLADLFHEISPIESYNKGMKLYFPSRTQESSDWKLSYWFGDPKHSLGMCRTRFNLRQSTVRIRAACWTRGAPTHPAGYLFR